MTSPGPGEGSEAGRGAGAPEGGARDVPGEDVREALRRRARKGGLRPRPVRSGEVSYELLL